MGRCQTFHLWPASHWLKRVWSPDEAARKRRVLVFPVTSASVPPHLSASKSDSARGPVRGCISVLNFRWIFFFLHGLKLEPFVYFSCSVLHSCASAVESSLWRSKHPATFCLGWFVGRPLTHHRIVSSIIRIFVKEKVFGRNSAADVKIYIPVRTNFRWFLHLFWDLCVEFGTVMSVAFKASK